MSRYIFVKDSKLERPKNIPYEQFASSSYGEIFKYEPQDVPIRLYSYSGSNTPQDDLNKLRSLKNTINYYKSSDSIFNFDNIYNNPCCLVCLSSYHLGSGIQKGTVNLKIFYSGSTLSYATDRLENGVIYDNYNNKVGLVLYKEGFIIINNTSSISDDVITYSYNINGESYDSNITWLDSFISNADSVYCEFDYDVVNSLSTNTYFAPVEKNELNYSNNLTYIESGSYRPITGSVFFKENEDIKLKNTVKSSFISGSSDFFKQTFITKIGLYDKEKKLIAVGNLANPIKKNENREYIFKIKLDI